MPWTDEDTQNLRSFRTSIDSDDIKIKEGIKQVLLDDKDIIHVLNNVELDEDEPDTYFGINILPYYYVSPVQTNVQNYICYTTHINNIVRNNQVFKQMRIVFTIVCHEKSIVQEDTFLQRHDLLGALIERDFNWKNYFGKKIHCVSSNETFRDKYYICRELVFEQTTENGIVNTVNGSTRTINKDVVTLG